MATNTIAHRRISWLLIILFLALILRLAYALSQDHLAVYTTTGGDSVWYLENGYTLVTNHDRGIIAVDVSKLPTAPLYLVYLGFWQALFSPQAAIIAIRVIQCLMSTATCYFVYRMGRSITDDERVGLVAAGFLAISPVFIVEAAQITTETLYIFCIAAALSLYIDWVARLDTRAWRALALVSLLLGLATLTRAVALLFPFGLALHLVIIDWRANWRRRLKQAGWLILVYVLVASTWTIYNLVRWNRFIIGGEGFASFLYIGADESGWTSPQEIDQRIIDENPQLTDPDNTSAYLDGAVQTIGSDPFGYVFRRVRDLADAYIQPHGTVLYPGKSLKQLVSDWLKNDHTLSGLIGLTRAEQFWPKLVLYVFHYVGLIGGVVGMWLSRKRWRLMLPLIGFILYTSLIHLVLDAIPRYIFPTEVCWWVFASVTLVALADRLAAVRRQRASVSPPSTIAEPR